ncbi:mucin-17-like [Lytechinus variegatus]|uniref:mucin-17-like n=1 Tax=Lytechinus variegatus TaxID=7654 RepID=UPI001BB22E51|nr:mucin-17-like [Lytechinus variegatus]
MDGPFAKLIERSAEKGNLIYPGVLLAKSLPVEEVLSFIDGQYKLAVAAHDELWIECLQEHLVDHMAHNLLISRYPHLNPSKNVLPKEHFPDLLFFDPGKVMWDPVLSRQHRRSADLLSTSAEFRKRASRIRPEQRRPPTSSQGEESKETKVLPGTAPPLTPCPDSTVNVKEYKDAKPLDTPTSTKKRKAKKRNCPITGCNARFTGSVRKHIYDHMPVCLRPSSETYTSIRAYSQARCLHYFAKHILQRDNLPELVSWLNAKAEGADYQWNLPEDLRFEMENLARHMEWPITDTIKVGPANHPASLLHWRALALLRNGLPENTLKGFELISSLGIETNQVKNNSAGSTQPEMTALNMQTRANTASSQVRDICAAATVEYLTTTTKDLTTTTKDSTTTAPSGSLHIQPSQPAIIPSPARPPGPLQVLPALVANLLTSVAAGSLQMRSTQISMFPRPAVPSCNSQIQPTEVARNISSARPSGSSHIHFAQGTTIPVPARSSGSFPIPPVQVSTIPTLAVPSGNFQMRPALGATIPTLAVSSGKFEMGPALGATIPMPNWPSSSSLIPPVRLATPTSVALSGSVPIPLSQLATIPPPVVASGSLPIRPSQVDKIPTPVAASGSLQILPSQGAEIPVPTSTLDFAPPSKVPKLYGSKSFFQTSPTWGSVVPSLSGAPGSLQSPQAPTSKAPKSAEPSESLPYTTSPSMAPNSTMGSGSIQVHPVLLQRTTVPTSNATSLSEIPDSLQISLAAASKLSTSSGTGMSGLSQVAKGPFPEKASGSFKTGQLAPIQVEIKAGESCFVRNNIRDVVQEPLLSSKTMPSSVDITQNSSRDTSNADISVPLKAYDSHFHLDHLEQETGKQGHDAIAAVTGRRPRVNIELCGGVLNYSDPAYFNQIHFPTKSSFRIAVGIHPCHAFCVSETDMSQLRNHLCDLQVCAVSEVGLDFSCPRVQWNCQKVLLRIILEMGVAGRVLILRLRADEINPAAERPSKECMKIMSECKVSRHQRIHLHLCDLNSEEVALWKQSYPECYFGFSSSSEHFGLSQQEALKLVPHNRLLLESNAPFLPIDLTAKSNSPAYIGEIAQVLAECQHRNLESVLRSTTDNAICLYGPWRH